MNGGFFMRFYWDPTYILVIIGAIISMIASWNVKHTYKKYSDDYNSSGVQARDVAVSILRNAGITDVVVERIQGDLTDHYSPKEKVLRLSDSVYSSTSVAAIGVAAHECGHAIQHNVKYFPIKIRMASVGFANFGSKLSWPIILLGLVLGNVGLAKIGVFLFTFVVFFQLITLPVEFNASGRALKILKNNQILVGKELSGARKVLSAAALTYVAALASSILQLLRLILIVNNRDRRR